MLEWLPENISTYGGDVDSMFRTIYYLAILAFVLWEGALLYMLFFFRGREGRKAAYVKGDKMRQFAWTFVPFLIVIAVDIFIDLRGAPIWSKIKNEMPEIDIDVRIMAEQFNWQVYYPGPDGVFDTEDDLQLENALHVPVDKKVRITLTSADVIHSFFVPVLRLKQDILPGRRIDVWFEATKAGRYEIPCAELCGFGHSGMLGYLYVHTEEDYNSWVDENWEKEDGSAEDASES